MRFLAQIRLADARIAGQDGLLLLFQCENDPGGCEAWEPESGCNAAIVVPLTPLEVLTPPPGETTLAAVQGILFEQIKVEEPEDEDDDYGSEYANAREQYEGDDEILGQTAGAPDWIQADETPTCGCGATMAFVVQLEDVGGGGMNFGDSGCGYGFVCPRCRTGRFLTQCA